MCAYIDIHMHTHPMNSSCSKSWESKYKGSY